jgi:hypothetical protein
MGLGPKFIRMGKSIRYRVDDVVAFTERCAISSTSEGGWRSRRRPSGAMTESDERWIRQRKAEGAAQ